ncbi:MAG TPA: adenylate/guanylate cyclase domain-containing protein [Methylomirabilota bacterium]|nr:adenylate/guanylate cyclase domain-containing protein [Methylomirabilota bacterium]
MIRISRWLRKFRGDRIAGLLLLFGLLTLRTWDPQPLQALRWTFFDLFQRALPRQETRYPVVIVDIDEQSLREQGQWPWPRSTLASMVNWLRQAGAVVIGFDVVFAEPDRNLSVDPVRLVQLPLSDLRSALTSLQTNDSVFADSMRQQPVGQGQQQGSAVQAKPRTPVVLGEFALTPSESSAVPPRDPPVTPGLIGGDPYLYLKQFAALTENIPELAQAAAGRGSISLAPDIDGIVRKVPLVVNVSGVIVPSFDIELLRVATGQKGYAIQMERKYGGVTSGIASINAAGVRIPTDRNGLFYLRYGYHDRARFVPAADVVAGRVKPERFSGKIVLIGTSASGLYDVKTTPTKTMPGVEVHAQLIENILAGESLARPGYMLGAEVFFTALGGLLLIILVPRLAARWTLGFHILAIVTLFSGSLYSFARLSILFDWTYPVISGTALYLLLIYIRYTLTERQRRQVTAQFKQYLAPAVVDQLSRDPDRVRLGGEIKSMTVMFADLRNFTGISERLRHDPESLTTLINRFLTPMTDAVLEKKGTIDKYIGDSMMAFWNAPVDVANHAAQACAAALSMSAALDNLNQTLLAEAEAGAAGAGVPVLTLGMGVGVNTGDCLVGNLGTAHHFNYSVLGDPVNLASRLESLTKLYNVGILISESTHALAPEFAALEVDRVAVVGKQDAVKAYGLLGGPGMAVTEAFQRLQETHGRFLAAYRRQDWEVAKALLDECRPLDERLNRLYWLYAGRIAFFERNPPDPDWDGVFRAENK